MAERFPADPARTPTALVENVLAPEVFATEATFFSLGTGIVSITFTSHRWDHATVPSVQKKVVIGRLVMPLAGAQGLAAGLYDFLAKQGLDPVPRPGALDQVQ